MAGQDAPVICGRQRYDRFGSLVGRDGHGMHPGDLDARPVATEVGADPCGVDSDDRELGVAALEFVASGVCWKSDDPPSANGCSDSKLPWHPISSALPLFSHSRQLTVLDGA